MPVQHDRAGETRRDEPASTPEECLRAALEALRPEARAQLAEEGLGLLPASGPSLHDETRALLLRQRYLALLELRRFERAAEVAAEMAAIGPLPDVARHDAARAWAAAAMLDRAVAQQRLAVRAAPPERRSFHHWALAVLLHQSGDLTGAEGALRRGLRWASRDRPLLRAQLAWVRLEAGLPVRGLAAVRAALESSEVGRGYGQYVLGMLALAMGDSLRAAFHLRAFLRRNASADFGKLAGLREELRRARAALASLESD
jgi:tetratricopeptide (TPR) repeat protein